MSEANLLQGKNAVVTGGGSGIGKEIAIALASEGASVAVIDINEDNGTKTVKQAREAGVRAEFYREDLSLPQEYFPLISSIEKDLGTIDILVNNAGISFTTKISDMRPETWDLVMGINARATFFMSQAVFAGMLKQKTGRIINIASISGDRPALFSDAAYCASKAAILMITKVFAKAAVETGITVNAVSPGIIETDLTRKLGSSVSPKDVPLARMGTVSEIADAVIFLASNKASYITGQNIRVNGGAYMG